VVLGCAGEEFRDAGVAFPGADQDGEQPLDLLLGACVYQDVGELAVGGYARVAFTVDDADDQFLAEQVWLQRMQIARGTGRAATARSPRPARWRRGWW
jgi:hypothetical protein